MKFVGQLAVPDTFIFVFLVPNPVSDARVDVQDGCGVNYFSEPQMTTRCQVKCDGMACEKVDDKYQMRPLGTKSRAEMGFQMIVELPVLSHVLGRSILLSEPSVCVAGGGGEVELNGISLTPCGEW